ncbi:hypothetical protein CR917_01605 [Pseudomonas sp. BRM28]|nr:hypothetical protein CR917_01605 [Pseudomonas sp. BRM28]
MRVPKLIKLRMRFPRCFVGIMLGYDPARLYFAFPSRETMLFTMVPEGIDMIQVALWQAIISLGKMYAEFNR